MFFVNLVLMSIQQCVYVSLVCSAFGDSLADRMGLRWILMG
jgi:hypothetical protein